MNTCCAGCGEEIRGFACPGPNGEPLCRICDTGAAVDRINQTMGLVLKMLETMATRVERIEELFKER
jgi:hypothetical protein